MFLLEVNNKITQKSIFFRNASTYVANKLIIFPKVQSENAGI